MTTTDPRRAISCRAPRPFWLDTDGGDTVRFLDQDYRMKAPGAQTGGLFGLVEVSTPQGSGPPPHVHEREDEAFYVLEGSYEVTVGDDRFDAREGGFIFAPRAVPHGYVVRAAPARHLSFVFPSGWETFYHDAIRAGGGAAPAPAMLTELAKQRGVTLLGPPPSR
jgi:quercetin dioxygenase-like cupin family protein